MKVKLNLSNRISLGYLFIIVVAVVATLFCIASLRNNQKLDEQIQITYQPTYQSFKDLNSLLSSSQKLASNWIYQPNGQEKEKLREIHKTEFPALKKSLESILEKNPDNENGELQNPLKQFEEILASQKELMSTLSADSLYSSDVAVDGAINIFDKKITPQSQELGKSISNIIADQEKKISLAQQEKQSSYALLTWLLLVMILLFIGAAWAAYSYSRKKIVQPIIELKNIILEIGRGRVVKANFDNREDEIGEMTTAITSLMGGINAKSAFADQIGKGNYAHDFQLISEDDAMGKSLLEMRKNLQENSEEERKRNWATQGLAEIGTILRAQESSADDLYNNIIKFVVKYIKGNQGGLFLLEENYNKEKFLKLIACYAFERKKFLEKVVRLGEGTLGQCVMERETIYLLDFPADYLRITSGLGDAPPTSLLIVPLKINEEVHGVMELASFNKFEKYQIDFIEKLAENIASSIGTIRVNERTKQLLESTQQQAEEMRSQEEEMRQNMEELTATQEEMQRNKVDSEGLLAAVNTSVAVIEFKPDGSIIKANDVFLTLMGYTAKELEKEHHRIFVNDETKNSPEYRKFWLDLAKGQELKGEFKRVAKNGSEVWIVGNYTPVMNRDGQVSKVIKVAYDITPFKRK